MQSTQRKLLITPLSKENVIAQFKFQLPLPEYCSVNWDSFEECLLDFLAENPEGINIVHEDNIKLPDEDRDAYLSILHDAMKSYNVIISS